MKILPVIPLLVLILSADIAPKKTTQLPRVEGVPHFSTTARIVEVAKGKKEGDSKRALQYQFDLTIVFEGAIADAEKPKIATFLKNCNKTLFDVTEGQMRFRTIHVHGGNANRDQADITVAEGKPIHPVTRTWLGNGTKRCDLIEMARVKGGIYTHSGPSAWEDGRSAAIVVHEFGHYALGLPDEFAGGTCTGCLMAGPVGVKVSKTGEDIVTELCAKGTHTYARERVSCWDALKDMYPKLEQPAKWESGPSSPPDPEITYP